MHNSLETTKHKKTIVRSGNSTEKLARGWWREDGGAGMLARGWWCEDGGAEMVARAGSDKNFCCLQTKFSYPCLPTKACSDIIFITLPVTMFKICIKCSYSA